MTVVHTTRRYHALAHDFRVTFADRALGEYFEALFDAFPIGPNPAEVTEYAVTTVDGDGAGYELRTEEQAVVTAATASALATAFVHHVNSRAIQADYAVMSHAGGVERDGIGVILPAHMESGKTTLTTGLVRAGFAYLTDESVAFDWQTGMIEPFPKPLSIDEGSWPLFPDLQPAPAPGEEQPPTHQWQVPVHAIRADALGKPCVARFVVFPAYEQHADTKLTPMTRADGLLELAKNTFKFNDHPRRALDALARVVRGAECYRLTVGDLDDACSVITELVDA